MPFSYTDVKTRFDNRIKRQIAEAGKKLSRYHAKTNLSRLSCPIRSKTIHLFIPLNLTLEEISRHIVFIIAIGLICI